MEKYEAHCQLAPRDQHGVRDLHQDDAGAPLGGDHRQAMGEVQLRSRDRSDWSPGSSYEASAPG